MRESDCENRIEADCERPATAYAYESEAEGRLELVGGKFQCTSVILRPRLTPAPGGDPAKAKELLEKAEAACVISNSITARVILDLTIIEG